jgi:hypothetical protein
VGSDFLRMYIVLVLFLERQFLSQGFWASFSLGVHMRECVHVQQCLLIHAGILLHARVGFCMLLELGTGKGMEVKWEGSKRHSYLFPMEL